MGTTIDSLQIEIGSNATSATTALNALTSSLNKLKQATSSCAGLETFSKRLKDFGSAAGSINSNTTTSLENLAAALSKFSSLGKISFPSTLGEKIKSFVECVKEMPYSYNGLANLGKALQNFVGVADVKIPAGIATGIKAIINAAAAIDDEKVSSIGLLATYLAQFKSVQDVTVPSIGSALRSIATALQSLDPSKFGALSQLASALSPLRGVSGITIPRSLANNLVNIAIAIEQLNTVNISVLNDLAQAIQPLSALGDMSNFAAALRQLAKLPTIIANLDPTTLANFATGIQQLATALDPLVTQLNNVSNGFSALPSSIRATITALQSMPNAANNAKRSSTDLLSSIKLVAGALKSIYQPLAKAVTYANKYVETLNLFNASLGSYASQAQAYGEKVGELVGIDPADWMEAQGVFYNLADGFGIASDRAYTMSQQLTQLSYDLASFYNISVEDAMLKLRGSLSGEIEMMRQLGVDLSNAAMQERATAMGIETKVTAMTQAEKAQLRYLIIMERTTTAQTDMARTLNAPANQLRVLSAQVTQAARAIGNIFIPILNKVLPYVITAAKAIRFLATSIASLFGYSLPEVTYSSELSSAASSAGDLSDNLGSAGSNAKKLKNALMGFDEINRLPDDSSGGGGGGGGGSSATLDGFDWELPTYNFLEGLVTDNMTKMFDDIKPILEWISDHLETILSTAGGIGAAMVGWSIASTFITDLGKAGALIGVIKGIAASAIILTISCAISWVFGNKFQETGNVGYVIGDLISTGLNTFFIGKIIGKVLKSSKAGYYAAAISLGLSAGITLKTLWDGIVYDEGSTMFNFKTVTSAIWAMIKGAGAGAMIGLATAGKAGIAAGGLIGGLITLTAAVAIIIIKSNIEMTKAQKKVIWGKLVLTEDEIKTLAEDLLNIDVTTTINVISGQIQNADTAKAELNTSIATFNALIHPLAIGAGIDETDKENLINYLNPENTDGLLQQLQQKLNETTLMIQITLNNSGVTNEEGEDQSPGILSSLITIDSTIETAAKECGEQLSALLTQGLNEGLDAQQQQQIINLTTWLNGIVNGAENAETIAKFKLSTSDLLTNIDKDSFTSILEEYKSQSEELETSLREAQEQAKLEYATKIEQLYAAEEYYRANGNTVLADSIAEQIAAAEEYLANWDVEASVAAAMEQYTSEGKQQLLQALQEIFSANLSDKAMGKFHDRLMTNLSDSFYDYANGEYIKVESEDQIDWASRTLTNSLNGALGKIYNEEDLSVLQSMAELMGTNILNVLPVELQKEFISAMVKVTDPSMIAPLFEKMGIEITPEILQIFEELGIEIPDALKEGIEGGEESVTDGVTEVINIAKSLFGDKNLKDTIKGFWGKLTSGSKGKISASSDVTLNFKLGKGSKIVPESKTVEYTVDVVKGWKEKNLTTWISPTWRKAFTVNLQKGTTVTWGASLVSGIREKANKLFDISLKANGGYVKNGEMFIANEAGAEMVGRIGRKSAVANESQIGDAIFRYMDAHGDNDGVNEESLARAIVSGMKQAGIGSVYLNGRDMANAINAETKRTGKSAIVF